MTDLSTLTAEDAAKMKWKCGCCGEKVAYGGHCSKAPNGDLTKDKPHQVYASAKGHLYEEDV